jgi:hypothetical protein
MEVYFYPQYENFLGVTQINYVKINTPNPILNAFTNNIILPLQDIDGINIPETYIFVYKNIQSNSEDSTLNATDVFTLKTNKGTIVYMLTPNSNIWVAGSKYITKPVFTTGFYLGR